MNEFILIFLIIIISWINEQSMKTMFLETMIGYFSLQFSVDIHLNLLAYMWYLKPLVW